MGGGTAAEMLNSQYSMMSTMQVYQELLPGEDGALVGDVTKSQYDLVYGSWPQAYDEVVLMVDRDEEISDVVLYTLGYADADELGDMVSAAMAGEKYEPAQQLRQDWSYADLCARELKIILPVEYWQYNESDGTYTDMSATQTGLEWLYQSESVGVPLKIVGIVRANSDAGMSSTAAYGGVGYTAALTQALIARVQESRILRDQMDRPDVDVFTDLPFATEDAPAPTDEEMEQAVRDYAAQGTTAQRAELYACLTSTADDAYVDQAVAAATEGLTREEIEAQMSDAYARQMGMDLETVRRYLAEMDDDTLMEYVESALRDSVKEQYAQQAQAALASLTEAQMSAALDASAFTASQYAAAYETVLPPTVSDSSYDENLATLGNVDEQHPSAIQIYAASFADKDKIADVIADYNAAAPEEQQISYTDYVALLMSSVTDIISGISYLLIAFVGISLVVSSVMIGIITYISVLERTREIGILRSIGASKGDISNVFNAETILVGLGAGLIGIGVTLVLNLPITALLHRLTGIQALNATLPLGGAVILVAISVALTFVAGLIPSRIAARKDPVEALRSE